MKARLLIAFAYTLFAAGAVLAQSSPGVQTGQVLSAAQWNSFFAAKVDTVGGVLSGGSMTGTLVTGSGLPTPRSVNSHFTDVLNLKDYGAACNGSTDDSVPFGSFETAGGGPVATGTCLVVTFPSAYKVTGPGQLIDGTGVKYAPRAVLTITAPTTSVGSGGPYGAIWNDDISRIVTGTETTISGAASLGQPSSGYLWTPEASPFVTLFTNTSGYNASNSTNSGRTGVAVFKTYARNKGQGDVVGYNAELFCNSTNVNATNFLAGPACIANNGDVNSYQTGTYLQALEYNFADNGYDTAAVGAVFNFTRTNGAAALGQFWAGVRIQASGSTAPIDAFFSGFGNSKVGLDFSTANFGSNNGAIAMAAGQRIYGASTNTDPNYLPNGVALGSSWMGYVSGGAGWELAPAGAVSLSADTTGHITLGSTAAPTIASGACGTGTNGSIAAGSNDMAGVINISSASTTSCAVSFAASWNSAPKACVFFPANSTAAAIGTTLPYLSTKSASGFTLAGSVLASTSWAYECM
jgi:hypothetical protein